MKVTLTYSDTVTASELATSEVSISNLGITINFEQLGSAEVDSTGVVSNNRVYHQGEKITLNNEDYYVIENSGAGQDYVVALKAKALTVAEVNLYGASIPITVYSKKGYGTMPSIFYSYVQVVDGNENISSCGIHLRDYSVVRPVINAKKSVLETNNE